MNKVLLIYTGGTIGMGMNPETKTLEPLDFDHLLDQLPEYKYIEAEVSTYQFEEPIDSSNATPELWVRLVHIIEDRYKEFDGFVILHGTDTMAYTASALSFMLQNLTKPVILTGSQLPIGQLRTDGKENLITSIELAALRNTNGLPLVPEVCVYFSGKLMRGNRSTKWNAEGFEAFGSYNMPTLCDAGVNIVWNHHLILQPNYNKPLITHYEMDNRVAVISLFPGICKEHLEYVLKMPDLKGIVLRTYGSGNAPQTEWFKSALKDAIDRGIVIVNVTQCGSGSVEMDRYEAGIHLQKAGVVNGRDITVEAAVTKLMHLLAQYDDVSIVRDKMRRPLVGEITV